MMSMFSSPGTPKMYSTPSFSRHFTNSCAAVIAPTPDHPGPLELLRFYLESDSGLVTALLPVALRRCDACHLAVRPDRNLSSSGTGSDATFLWQTNAHRPRRPFPLEH